MGILYLVLGKSWKRIKVDSFESAGTLHDFFTSNIDYLLDKDVPYFFYLSEILNRVLYKVLLKSLICFVKLVLNTSFEKRRSKPIDCHSCSYFNL